MIGLKVWRHFSTTKKQNRNSSRALSRLHVIVWNSDWLIALFAPVLIGRSNDFGIGFPIKNIYRARVISNDYYNPAIPLLLVLVSFLIGSKK